jgi:ADP-heptose:LPS heptosyltransferase
LSLEECRKRDLKQLVHSGEAMNYQEPEYITRYKYCMQKAGVLGSKAFPMPYAPQRSTDIEGEYVVIARGCIDHPQAAWKNHKEVGDEIFKYIMGNINLPIYIVGNTADYKRSLHRMENFGKDVKFILDDINKVVGCINHAKYFISNDTGLMHVASALQKKCFILWKDTPFVKNKPPGPQCFFSMKNNWYNDFNKWIKGV